MDRDIVTIEQWISFGRRVFRWFSLLRLERQRLSTLSVDVLCPSARSNWCCCHHCASPFILSEPAERA